VAEKVVYKIVYFFANGEKYTKEVEIDKHENGFAAKNNKIREIINKAITKGIWVVAEWQIVDDVITFDKEDYYPPESIHKIRVIHGEK